MEVENLNKSEANRQDLILRVRLWTTVSGFESLPPSQLKSFIISNLHPSGDQHPETVVFARVVGVAHLST